MFGKEEKGFTVNKTFRGPIHGHWLSQKYRHQIFSECKTKESVIPVYCICCLLDYGANILPYVV